MMAFIRLPLALLGSAVVIALYSASGSRVGAAAGLAWAPLTLTVVNIGCYALLRWRAHQEGFRLRDLVGSGSSLARDLALGLVLSVALGGLLVGGVVLAGVLLYGGDVFMRFGDVFVGDADFSFDLPWWLAVVSAVVFPLVNAPVEELQYRGYAQPRLVAAAGSVWIGIVVTAVGFGLQHVVFAVTLPAAFIYASGFLLWGIGAGLVAQRQQRLTSLIVAHFVSNASFGVIPLVLILTA